MTTGTMPRWEPFAVIAVAAILLAAAGLLRVRIDAARNARRAAAVQDLIASGLTVAEAEWLTADEIADGDDWLRDWLST